MEDYGPWETCYVHDNTENIGKTVTKGTTGRQEDTK